MKQFDVRMKVQTKSGAILKLVAHVTTVPGVDVFATARQAAEGILKARRKGSLARVFPGAVAIAA